MADVLRESVEAARYKLYGVLYHHSGSAGGVGVSVDALHPSRNSVSGEAWLHIDDEGVSAVRYDEVFGGHNDERVDGRCVCMLYYCRTASIRTL